MALLEIDSIDAFYGDFQALFGLTLDVTAGETVALIGANGAGKTTFLRCLVGLMEARRGEIGFAGEAIAGRIKALAATGMAIIVVEHLMGFIEQITDRVIVLNAGKEIFEGTLATAVREPQVIEVFLGGEHAH
jgi:ABC-type branched-subunit amino acid transport system ATPase component